MNILVTGGTGFLGKALALRLVAEGHAVSVMGRNLAIGAALEAQGIRFIAADLSDADTIEKACSGQAAVFHCAALSSPWGAYAAFYKANVIGTQNVIQGCRWHGVERLIHVSTPSIYFDYQDRLNIREDTPLPLKGCNYYADTKRQAEALIAAAQQLGLGVITIRPRGIFGPGDTALIPRIIRANRRGGLLLIEGGNALVDITYVDNVVDALCACLNAPASALGRQFNITNGEPMALKIILDHLFLSLNEPARYRPMRYSRAYRFAGLLELASRCFTLSRVEPLVTRYTLGVLAKSQTLDISAARHVLGYEPRISIYDGLQRFASWWKREAS